MPEHAKTMPNDLLDCLEVTEQPPVATNDNGVELPAGAASELSCKISRTRRDSAVPRGFRVTPQGTEKCIVTKEGEEWFWFCGPLYVVALERTFDSDSWGLRCVAVNSDGTEKTVTFPRAMVANDAAALRERLANIGLRMLASTAAKAALNAYLSLAEPRKRITTAANTGWNGTVFVLPDAAFGAAEGIEVSLQHSSTSHRFNQNGTLEDWKAMTALLVGNSRLVMAVCVAAAAPLLKLVEAESGGVHIHGPSSTGKSTALFAAGAFWGGGGLRANLLSWRTTDSAMESVARLHCDTSIMIDEVGQAKAQVVYELAYMLANGAGKSRGTRDGGSRAAAQWRLTFVSTGEVALADKVAESGNRAMAGQAVRIVDVPLPEAGMGIFERLPTGFATASAFAQHLQEVSKRCYGTACRPFLARVTANYDAVADAVRELVARFVSDHCSADADGQVYRVAERFGLFAAAGELASKMGIVAWPEGEATSGVSLCFRSWLNTRGGQGSAESMSAVAQVKEFLQRYAVRHFDVWQRNVPGGPSVENRAQDRWGFRTNVNGQNEFWLTSAGYRKLCTPHDLSSVSRELIQLGILRPAPNGGPSATVNIPGEGKVRCYHIVPNWEMIEHEEAADAE